MAGTIAYRLEASRINRERVDAFEAALNNLANQHGFVVTSLRITEERGLDHYPEMSVTFLQVPKKEPS